MQPSRRSLLKQLLFVSIGTSILPSCLLLPQKPGIKLKHIQVSSDQEMLFASFASTLIPSGDTPGARETAADLFAWKILDDCTEAKEQKIFLKGLDDFGKKAQIKLGKFFINASEVEKTNFLQYVSLLNDPSDPLMVFFQNAKKRIIQAYTGSEYFLTNIQVYEQISARFHGSVQIS